MITGIKTKIISGKVTSCILVLFIGIVIFSCETKKPGSNKVAIDSLLLQYQALSDSVDHNWVIMIADDDDKHVLMRRLLLEVSYTNNYDKTRYQELKDLVDELKAMRYDQTSMSNSASIDAYDSATFSVSDQIVLFARSHPRFEDTPLMGELIDDINSKNNYILLHRIHYDGWVKKFNLFNERNRNDLIQCDPAIKVETMPLFDLPS